MLDLEIEFEKKRESGREALLVSQKSAKLYKSLASQAEQDKKANALLESQVQQLQRQLKMIKKQVEEAEDIASINLSKFRKASGQLKEAEERAEYAESELMKLKKN